MDGKNKLYKNTKKGMELFIKLKQEIGEFEDKEIRKEHFREKHLPEAVFFLVVEFMHKNKFCPRETFIQEITSEMEPK